MRTYELSHPQKHTLTCVRARAHIHTHEHTGARSANGFELEGLCSHSGAWLVRYRDHLVGVGVWVVVGVGLWLELGLGVASNRESRQLGFG